MFMDLAYSKSGAQNELITDLLLVTYHSHLNPLLFSCIMQM